MDERRQLPRWQIKREARVRLPQVLEYNNCIIENMTLKGMQASFEKQLPQELPLNLILMLENNFDVMKIEVQIPWARQEQGRFVYGMYFSKIMDLDKSSIEHYIHNHCSEQYKDKWWGQESNA